MRIGKYFTMAANRKYWLLLLVAALVAVACVIPGCSPASTQVQTKENIEFTTEEAQYSATYFCSLFDELDSKVNGGKGYSEYLNTDGFPTGALLAWSESKLMQAYANMYEVTCDVKYADKLHEHILAVMANRDDKIGKSDYKGELVPSWGATKYSRNKEYTHNLLLTSLITYPMLEFIDLARENRLEYQDTNEILKQVEESISSFPEEWVVNKNGGYYQFADDSPIAYGQKMVPTNSFAAAGRCFVLLHKLTGKAEYLERAAELAKTFKHSLVADKNGAYIWGYRL